MQKRENNKYKLNYSTKYKKEYEADKQATEKKTSAKKEMKSFKERRPAKGECPYSFKCGGCDYQGIPYEEQLEKKQHKVEDLLSAYCKVDKIIGMKQPKHYRNKVHSVFGRLKNGTYISGVYEKNSHRIVNIDDCMITNQKANAIIVSIRSLLKSFKIMTYDEDTDYGLLRHVLIRTGHESGQILVIIVISSPILPSKNNFVKALLKLHPEITSIVLNINDRQTSMVLGGRQSILYGKGYIEDTLCGLKFRISPKSFYQVNPVQTEILYEKAISLANLTQKETIVDAYCGVGTIGLIAASRAKEVIGVELNKDAVADARLNAKMNDIQNVHFYQKDAGQFMMEMAEQHAKCDVVFMDPPRTGSDEAFLTSVLTLSPEKIVYISCNPETLARDLKILTKKYIVKKICPVDMFAMTGHVEVVTCLQRVDM